MWQHVVLCVLSFARRALDSVKRSPIKAQHPEEGISSFLHKLKSINLGKGR